MVSFLAGPDSGWVNGQVLRANGGLYNAFQLRWQHSTTTGSGYWSAVEDNKTASSIVTTTSKSGCG